MGLTVANIGFGRSHISAGCCLDSGSDYANRAVIQASRSVFPEQFLYDALEVAIVALTEVVITNSPFPVDEILRWPVFVVERLPNPVIAVDGNGIGDIQIAYGVLYIAPFFLEGKFRRMHADHSEAGLF